MKKWRLKKGDLAHKCMAGKNWFGNGHWLIHVVHLSPVDRQKLGLGLGGFDQSVMRLTWPKAELLDIDQGLLSQWVGDTERDATFEATGWTYKRGSFGASLYSGPKGSYAWIEESYARWWGPTLYGPYRPGQGLSEPLANDGANPTAVVMPVDPSKMPQAVASLLPEPPK